MPKVNDFEKMISILSNQQLPKKEHDWEPIKLEIRKGSRDGTIDIKVKEDSIVFVFDDKTKRLKYISNYKY